MKKNIKNGIIFAVASFLIAPSLTYALGSQGSGLLTSNSTLSDLIASILKIFNSLVPLLIGAAVVVFLYGVFVFIVKSSGGDAGGRKEAINFMVFGIIGIAVMVSLWGLVAFVNNTLGTSSVVPQFNSTSQSSPQSKNIWGF